MVVRAQPTRANIVHPCAAAFARTRTWVQIKLTHQGASAFNAVELNTFVPDGCGVFADTDFKKRLHNFEQTCQHFGGSEIHLHFLLAESVARFLQLFTDVGPVPSLWVFELELLCGELAQFGYIFFCIGSCSLGKVVQEGHHLGGRLSHLAS